MSAADLTGWIVLAALALVLAVQSRRMRGFVRLPPAAEGTCPSLTVVIEPGTPDEGVRGLISQIDPEGHPGEIEILLVARSQDEAKSMATLTLASSRVRVVDSTGGNGDWMQQVAGVAQCDLVLVLPSSVELEPGSLARLASHAVSEEIEAALLVPRLELRRPSAIALEPLVIWLSLTLLSPSSASAMPAIEAPRILTRRCITGRPECDLRFLDGYDAASRRELPARDLRPAIVHATGDRPIGRIASALLLVLLFTLPLPVAIVTKSFPWIVSAVVSYWLRLRVAVRTGEPGAAALLHPISALVAAAIAIAGSGRPATSSDDSRT